MKKSKVRILEEKADLLYQRKLKEEKPYSVISGELTEVIHHCIPKSQSNALRYDWENGVPLTNKEHSRHHLSGDPAILAQIIIANGADWWEDINSRRHTITKMNQSYLKEIIKKLE